MQMQAGRQRGQGRVCVCVWETHVFCEAGRQGDKAAAGGRTVHFLRRADGNTRGATLPATAPPCSCPLPC